MSGMKKWKVGNTDSGKPWKDGTGNAKRVRTLQESCCENAKKSENPAISCSKEQEVTRWLTNPQQWFSRRTTCKVGKLWKFTYFMPDYITNYPIGMKLVGAFHRIYSHPKAHTSDPIAPKPYICLYGSCTIWTNPIIEIPLSANRVKHMSIKFASRPCLLLQTWNNTTNTTISIARPLHHIQIPTNGPFRSWEWRSHPFPNNKPISSRVGGINREKTQICLVQLVLFH